MAQWCLEGTGVFSEVTGDERFSGQASVSFVHKAILEYLLVRDLRMGSNIG